MSDAIDTEDVQAIAALLGAALEGLKGSAPGEAYHPPAIGRKTKGRLEDIVAMCWAAASPALGVPHPDDVSPTDREDD